MISIKELAEACGVSVSAASKAMNHQKGISPEKAELVREKARELGYFPNAAARTMRTNRSRNIGLLFNNRLAHDYFSLVLEAIRDRAETLGYDITFLGNNPHTDMGYYEHAKNRQCEGVIISQGNFEQEGLLRLVESELPVVSIEEAYLGRTAIVNNNVESMREIIRYLYAQGHRRIAFVHGELGSVTKERLAGFYQGCRDCGIQVPEAYVIQARFHEPKDSGLATRALLALKNRPTCILYPDDVSTLGGLTEISTQGLRVPEDISCFGYDGIRLASILRPALTTYWQDAKAIGTAAVDQLISAVEDPKCYVPRIITINGKIQEGQTVCRISG